MKRKGISDSAADRAMTGEPKDTNRAGSSGDAAEEEQIRALLRDALARPPAQVPDVLRGVQRKLRQRSRGKFYGDGWSTSREPPIQTYLVTSLIMLALALSAYAVLTPLSGTAQVVPPSAPVHLVQPTILESTKP